MSKRFAIAMMVLVGVATLGLTACDPTGPLSSPVVGIAAMPDGSGYALVGADGNVFNFGGSGSFGNLVGQQLAGQIVGMAMTPTGKGYWLAGADGGVFSFGDAHFYGSAATLHLKANVVGITASPDGAGYWLVAADGGVFAYGDAGFHGSATNLGLNKPVVGMAATPDGGGYWLVASDGGVFAYGNAVFHGSAGNITLNQPIVGMAATPNGGGYWLVAADGGIFAYGNAVFHGSAANVALNCPVTGIARTRDGGGYWLTAGDGGVFTYGNATFDGAVVNGGTPCTTAQSAGTSCAPANTCSPETFADAIFANSGVHAPITSPNEFAMETWERAEGGGAGGPGQPPYTAPWPYSPGPACNPLATTQHEPGSTNWNSVGVQVYHDGSGNTCWGWGITANATVLLNGRYGPVLTALRNPVSDNVTQCTRLAVAVGSTPWGTGDFSRFC